MKLPILLVLLIMALLSCTQTQAPHAWLEGDEHQRIDTVARHLRGNDLVMWEVNYRYNKLYEAIKTSNNEYALYQLKKIKLTMANGAERRSKRKKSYEWFFANAIPPMEQAIIDKKDPMSEFKVFTSKCVTCHTMENVAYMPIKLPWLNE